MKRMFCRFCEQESPPPFKRERYHVHYTCKQCSDNVSRVGI